jgi:hypothetical protein
MLDESDAPDDPRAERDHVDERAEDERGEDERGEDERGAVERHAQMHDPESPGATIDTDHPAEPNEPA